MCGFHTLRSVTKKNNSGTSVQSNGHITQDTSLVSLVLHVWLKGNETEVSAAL